MITNTGTYASRNLSSEVMTAGLLSLPIRRIGGEEEEEDSCRQPLAVVEVVADVVVVPHGERVWLPKIRCLVFNQCLLSEGETVVAVSLDAPSGELDQVSVKHCMKTVTHKTTKKQTRNSHQVKFTNSNGSLSKSNGQ